MQSHPSLSGTWGDNPHKEVFHCKYKFPYEKRSFYCGLRNTSCISDVSQNSAQNEILSHKEACVGMWHILLPTVDLEKNAQCESCASRFYWGKMRTVARRQLLR